MWSIHFIAAVVLLLLVMQWSNARNLNVASGIANRQLTIEELRDTSVQTTSSSNDANNCTICLDHVGRNESASPNYPSSNGPFPCGHGIQIHEGCFNEYLTHASASNVKCSICRADLHEFLTDAQKLIIVIHAEPTTYAQNRLSLSADEFAAIVRRWPRIEEIGYARVGCGDVNEMFVLRCANAVLHGYVRDFVSPMMKQYLKKQDEFLQLQIWRNYLFLWSFSKFRVYTDVDGNLITIGEAHRRSLHSASGEPYFRGIRRIDRLRSLLPNQDIIRKLSQFPKLADFINENFQENGKVIGTIRDAVSLLCIEFVNTEILDQKLQIANDQVVQAKANVDDFLQRTYPNIVEYKSINILGKLPGTIEYLVTTILHPAISSDFAMDILPKINAGAKSIKRYVDEYIKQKYGHCNIIHRKMENTPGRDVTFYTAIKFTLIPKWFESENDRWVDAINNQLRSHDCKPKDVPSIRSMRYRFPKLYKRAANLQHRISN